MDQATKEDRLKTLAKMKVAVTGFYLDAQACGIHPFLEFAGFMQEYLKMLQGMLVKDIDFMDNELRAQPYEMEYVAEKLDCIYGDAARDPKNASAFYKALAEKGWPTIDDLRRVGDAMTID
jgi:hypothetical protein